MVEEPTPPPPNLDFSEMKEKCPTLAKRRLCQNELHCKLPKAPKVGVLKSLIRRSFSYSRLWPKSNASPIHLSKVESSDTTLTLLNHHRMSKAGQTPLSNHDVFIYFIFTEFEDNSNS
jgi:hypothetical protein